MTHDPMCPYKPAVLGTAGTGKYVAMVQGQPPVGCQCDLIARVLEDERTKRDANGFWPPAFQDGYAAALRDAVDVVKAMPIPTLPERYGILTPMLFRADVVAAIEALGDER